MSLIWLEETRQTFFLRLASNGVWKIGWVVAANLELVSAAKPLFDPRLQNEEVMEQSDMTASYCQAPGVPDYDVRKSMVGWILRCV